MSRYDFQSPGAAGANALEEFFVRQQLEQRQKVEDEFKRRQAEEQMQRQAQELALRQQQESRVAAAQTQAQTDLEQEREFRRAGTITENAVPGDRADPATVDLLTRQGMGGQVTPGVIGPAMPEPFAPGTPAVMVAPQGQATMRGGSKFLTAQAGREAAAANAEATREATAERAREAEAGRMERARMAASEDTAPSLEPSALDMAARMYAKTGQLPPMGMGKQGAIVRSSIINRAAQYDGATDSFLGGGAAPDIAGNKAGFAADSQTLTALTKNMGAVSAFEETARKNSELLEGILSKIPGQNTPTFLNTPLRKLATTMGNEDMARFNALRRSVQNEYARIVSQPSLSGVLSDSARSEMDTIMAADATPGQIRAALAALQQEATNRKQSFTDQIGEVRGRIRGGPATTPTAPAAKKPTAQELIQKYGR